MEVSPRQRALSHYPLPDADREMLAVWLFESNTKAKRRTSDRARV